MFGFARDWSEHAARVSYTNHLLSVRTNKTDTKAWENSPTAKLRLCLVSHVINLTAEQKQRIHSNKTIPLKLYYRCPEVRIQFRCHGHRKCLDVVKLWRVGTLDDICVMINKVKETVYRVWTGLYSCKITTAQINLTFHVSSLEYSPLCETGFTGIRLSWWFIRQWLAWFIYNFI